MKTTPRLPKTWVSLIFAIVLLLMSACNKEELDLSINYPDRMPFGTIETLAFPALDFYPDSISIGGRPAVDSNGDAVFMDYTDNFEMQVTKVSTEGEVIWRHQYGSRQQYAGIRVRALNGEGYVLFGKQTVLNFGNRTTPEVPFVMKLDANGSELWCKTFGSFKGECTGLHEMSNGDFIVVSYTGSVGQVRRIDGMNGEEIWVHEVLDGKRRILNSMQLLANDEFFIGGAVYDGSKAQFLGLFIDAEGQVSEQNTFGEAGFDPDNERWDDFQLYSTPTGVYIAGHFRNMAGDYDVYFKKYDPLGNQESFNVYGAGGNEYLWYMLSKTDGTPFFVLFSIEDTMNDPNNGKLLLTSLDDAGNWQSAKSYEGIKWGNIQPSSSGGFLLTARLFDTALNVNRSFLLELDEDGNPR